MKPVIINFVAAQSKTGKTTVLEKLIPELKNRGIRVAALKGNLRHYNLDTPGKDSWRLARAGAEIAGLTTPEGYMLIGSAGHKESTAAAAELLQDFDLILVEGNKKSPYPKIELIRSNIGSEPLIPGHTVAVLSDRDDLKTDLPVLKIDDITALADFIEQHFLEHRSTNAAGEENGAADFTHFDRDGRPRMVDVSNKDATLREACARGEIVMDPSTLDRITAGQITKGDVFSVAQVAAVMAVKETGRLIPMAHPLGISGVEVDFQPVKEGSKVEIGVRVRLTGQTGVEMEALTGVSVAALTIYDMCKAVDKNMIIQNIRLIEKKGGRSGHYRREQL